MNFETSGVYLPRERAALSYAEAITWRLDPDDDFCVVSTSTSAKRNSWARVLHFTHHGQQSGIRLLNIEHHQVMAGRRRSEAPGFETVEDVSAGQGQPTTYWVTEVVLGDIRYRCTRGRSWAAYAN